MKLLESIQHSLGTIAMALRLVPSETSKLKSDADLLRKERSSTFDRKVAIEDEVRELESRLLKLDARARTQHGALLRGTKEEMKSAVIRLRDAEKRLKAVISQIEEQDFFLSEVDKTLTGKRIAATTWDRLGIEREEQIANSVESLQAEDQVKQLTDPEVSGAGRDVDVDDTLAEIRGETTPPESEAEAVARNLRERGAYHPPIQD